MLVNCYPSCQLVKTSSVCCKSSPPSARTLNQPSCSHRRKCASTRVTSSRLRCFKTLFPRAVWFTHLTHIHRESRDGREWFSPVLHKTLSHHTAAHVSLARILRTRIPETWRFLSQGVCRYRSVNRVFFFFYMKLTAPACFAFGRAEPPPAPCVWKDHGTLRFTWGARRRRLHETVAR